MSEPGQRVSSRVLFAEPGMSEDAVRYQCPRGFDRAQSRRPIAYLFTVGQNIGANHRLLSAADNFERLRMPAFAFSSSLHRRIDSYLPSVIDWCKLPLHPDTPRPLAEACVNAVTGADPSHCS